MIKLNQNPVEGGAVSLNLNFKDTHNNFYIPLTLNYTVLALNNDKASWSVVDNLYKISLTPQSAVSLVVNKMSLISGTTLQRKIIVNWTALINGEITDFVDEVQFDVQPKPYIVDEPPEPTPTPIYLRMNDCSLQVGVMSSAPVTPVFIMAFNLPVNTDEGIIYIQDEDDNHINVTAYLDSTKTKVTVAPVVSLENSKSYKLIAEDLVSIIYGYPLESDIEIPFVTEVAGAITLESLQEQINNLDERVTALEG